MPEQSMQLITQTSWQHEGKDPIQAEDRWKAGSLPSRQCTPPYGQNNNGNPPEIEMDLLTHPPYSTDLFPSDFYLFGRLKLDLQGMRFADDAVIQTVREWICRQPQAFFLKGHQDASRTLEKLCWLRRGVRWRLTCASKCLVIMVLKKISPGHIWTT